MCIFLKKNPPSRLSTISHVYTRREIKNTTAKPIHGQKKRAEINEKTLNYSRFKFTFFFSLYTIFPKKKAMESYGSIYTAVVPTVNSTDWLICSPHNPVIIYIWSVTFSNTICFNNKANYIMYFFSAKKKGELNIFLVFFIVSLWRDS